MMTKEKQLSCYNTTLSQLSFLTLAALCFCKISLPEVEGLLQGRPISRPDCLSGTVCSPYQRVCGGLEAGKPCTSHYHCIHTPPSPAAGTEPPLVHARLHFMKKHENIVLYFPFS